MQDFNERNYEKIGELLEEVFKEYAAKENSVSDEEFLRQMLANCLPKFSVEEIDKTCKEIFESNRDMKDFLDKAKISPGYENATQNWFHEKIKDSLDKEDYSFMQRLCIENEILSAVNRNILQISNDFQKLGTTHSDDKISPYDEQIISRESHAGKKSISTTNIHKAAFD